jgi:hypothetical protein
MPLQTIFDLAEKRRVVFQKSGVKFKPVDTERGRHFDPIQKRHRVANAQFVYKALRKTSELRFHHSSGTWTNESYRSPLLEPDSSDAPKGFDDSTELAERPELSRVAAALGIRLPMKLGDVMWLYGNRNSAR